MTSGGVGEQDVHQAALKFDSPLSQVRPVGVWDAQEVVVQLKGVAASAWEGFHSLHLPNPNQKRSEVAELDENQEVMKHDSLPDQVQREGGSGALVVVE